MQVSNVRLLRVEDPSSDLNELQEDLAILHERGNPKMGLGTQRTGTADIL